MAQKDTIIRHRIIIQKLRSSPSGFEEIQKRLNAEAELHDYENLAISKRTFQRDILEIATLYNIEIKFDRGRKVYFIAQDEQDDYSERMFEALDVFQALNLSQSFSAAIQFDARKPSGTEHLSGILYAIQNKFQIRFRYRKFWSDEEEIRTVEPYLLKEFRKRWYVFAFDLDKKEFRTFGLDRMNGMEIKSLKFQFPQKIKPKEYFQNSFGIIAPDSETPTEEILLRFYKNQGEYVRTMPLHESQEILEENGEEMLVKLKLAPTWDFMMEILYYGELVKVIEPKHFADQIKKRLEKAVKLYGK